MKTLKELTMDLLEIAYSEYCSIDEAAEDMLERYEVLGQEPPKELFEAVRHAKVYIGETK